MNKISGIEILDCTLRDGGYINDWNFGRKTIASILEKLQNANIDIIECGFLTGMVNEKESSLFNSVEEITDVMPKTPRSSMFVAMIAIGEKELEPDSLSPHSENTIDGIRLTFHKHETDKAISWAKTIMKKGYKVFMQPVGTVFYSDIELLRLVEKMNELEPYAFYIVDTLGSMYRNEVSHRFYLIDENLKPQIKLGFHAHNNMQLAFSNAQVLGKIQTKRTLILDSSVYGMGRGAGNLPTELIAQYINRKIETRYDVSIVMDIYDEYISDIRSQYEWGYTMPYHIAASHVCHPSYAAYLINRRTLTMKDIDKIIGMIPKEYRVLYDRELIEKLYTAFQSRKTDDTQTVKTLTEILKGKTLLICAPGKTLSTQREKIAKFIKAQKPYIISVNFIEENLNADACFISSNKRMDIIGHEIESKILKIITSNITKKPKNGFLCVNYDSYINSDPIVSDNAGLMLIELLRKCGVKSIYLAGFDGLYNMYSMYSEESVSDIDFTDIDERHRRIRIKLKEFSKDMKIEFLTPSVYETKEGE